MGLIDYARNKIRSFLHIDKANIAQITIKQRLDYNANAAKNRIWYRGESSELSDLYGQLDVPKTVFWKAASTKGMEIRKAHTGVPKLIVKVLSNIIMHDYNGVEIEQAALQEIWDDTSKDNKFEKILKKAVREFLMVGDGAFKISFDKDISMEYPIIEFIPGELVEYERKRGRITEVVFSTFYNHDKKDCVLKEHYGKNYIKYELLDSSNKPIPLNSIPQTSWIDSEGFAFQGDIMLAVPVIFGESEQYEGRGESLFDGKTDSFDALDEAWSQWLDALRAGRTKEYIPNCLLPHDPDTGEIIKPNSFDNRFIEVGDDLSEGGSGNRIYTEQPSIPHDSYLATYVTALDLALQGLISPSTLGIDVKKLDNAEAQREKEKTTLYTRGNIIDLLGEIIPEVIVTAVVGYQNWHKKVVEKPDVTVKFGEYANPSFESQIETISKGRGGAAVMSIEAGVDELYGDDKDEEWKREEVARIKAEQGIIEMPEPSAGDEVGF